MDKLWAPWRTEYVTKIVDKKKGCLFCQLGKSKKDKDHYIFIRTKYSYGVLNIYPYNNGHVMLVSNRHVKDLSKLSKPEREDLMDLLDYAQALLQKALKPAGFNMGMNVGRVAGAGFPGHLHIHLVPRWKGDVNFMPVVGNTKVISQSLQALYACLKKNQKNV